MKLTDILNSGKTSLSFEVFPPKSNSSFDSVKGAIEKIASLNPSFVSVTYGAAGGASQYTLDMAKAVKERFGVPTVAHLTCAGATRETLSERISRIEAAGIENILALRGDIPNGDTGAIGDYKHAIDLIHALRSRAKAFSIGGACYPEMHPESKSRKEDIYYLKEKVDAGLDFLTTQMFFDNNLLYSFLYKIREAGISVPVIAGIMPITNRTQLERAVSLSGSFVPQRFMNLVDKFGDDKAAMKQAGIAYATDQIIDLFSNGINNVHIYTMNSPDVAEKIQANLSEIIGKL